MLLRAADISPPTPYAIRDGATRYFDYFAFFARFTRLLILLLFSDGAFRFSFRLPGFFSYVETSMMIHRHDTPFA